MQPGRLSVQVRPGMFTSELAVSFEVAGQQYTLFVDRADVENGFLKVYVVAEGEQETVIDLPRDTFTSGNRIRVPAGSVQPA
jgi:hypothetical protein